MKEIIVNLKRVPLLFYILSTAICFVFILLSTAYFADDQSNNQSMLIYMLSGDHSLSALTMWHNVLSSSDMNTWLLILTPLICCIPYVYSFCIEMNTKCYIFSLNRQGLHKFLLSRFIGSGLFSAIVMLIALILSVITSIIYCGTIGNYAESPIAIMLLHHQSNLLAFIEVCITYMFYAFLIGIICITLSSFISNAFTSCSTLVLILFLCGDIQSSYRSKFQRRMFDGEISQEDYNHFTDFLFVGNLAHGMPEFQYDFHVSYVVYMLAFILMIVILYMIFYSVMKKKVIL